MCHFKIFREELNALRIAYSMIQIVSISLFSRLVASIWTVYALRTQTANRTPAITDNTNEIYSVIQCRWHAQIVKYFIRNFLVGIVVGSVGRRFSSQCM